MAFFKFRLPGKTGQAGSEGLATEPGPSIEAIRRKARHRLLGSVILVFVAVVAFPLIFDSQPRPVSVDTPILIPDRQSTPPLAAGVAVPPAHAPAKPLLPEASSEVSAQASLEPGKEEVMAPAKALPDAVPAVKPTVETAQSSPPSAPAKAEPPRQAKDSADGQKAAALLEGKTPHAPRLIVQVGAFTDADKVREVRRKLEQAGLKTYTQMVDGKDGKRIIRVRVGPFDSRSDAEKAATRIRKLDLPASVISL